MAETGSTSILQSGLRQHAKLSLLRFVKLFVPTFPPCDYENISWAINIFHINNSVYISLICALNYIIINAIMMNSFGTYWYPVDINPRSASICWVKFCYNDVIEWKHIPLYWPFMQRIHPSPVNSPHKGRWCGTSMFSLICAWTNSWVNNQEPGDLKRHRAHCDVTVMVVEVLYDKLSCYQSSLLVCFISFQKPQNNSIRWQFYTSWQFSWRKMRELVTCVDNEIHNHSKNFRTISIVNA